MVVTPCQAEGARIGSQAACPVIMGVDIDPAGCGQQSVGRNLAPRRPRLAADRGSEGLANHTGPESCVGIREDAGEALTGERIGQPSSRESLIFPDADVVRITEGNMGSAITRAPAQSGVVEDPEHVWKLFAREPGGLGFGRRVDTAGPRRQRAGSILAWPAISPPSSPTSAGVVQPHSLACGRVRTREHGFGGHRVGDRVAVGGEHAAFERRAILARSPHQPYAAKMDRERELKIIRRAYAKQVTAAAGVGDPRVEAAFAAVAREDFLGPGPWHIVRWGGGYRATPDADPIYLYTDDVIGILPKRNLNNGQPSLHAALIAAAAPQPGEHVLHIGVGVGYYTAILAELVGATGRVTAIEYDAELAARATANLAQTPHVRVVHGDGTRIAFEPADVIYVNAGATRPADAWLDRL